MAMRLIFLLLAVALLSLAVNCEQARGSPSAMNTDGDTMMTASSPPAAIDAGLQFDEGMITLVAPEACCVLSGAITTNQGHNYGMADTLRAEFRLARSAAESYLYASAAWACTEYYKSSAVNLADDRSSQFFSDSRLQFDGNHMEGAWTPTTC